LRARRPLLHSLLLLVLLARSAVAAGYMPDGDGRLLALCPEGLPAAVAEALLGSTGHDHSGHDDSDHDAHSDWALERCALGAALAAAGPPMAEAAWTSPGIETLLPSEGHDLYFTTLPAAFRARAPPIVYQHD